MAIEIERKFLVAYDDWLKVKWRVSKDWKSIVQGYIRAEKGFSIRVRLVPPNGILTVKAPMEQSLCRFEAECEIGYNSAEKIVRNFCGKRTITKFRHFVKSSDKRFVWEVDEFCGRHHGLIIAEIELDKPDRRIRTIPQWIGREVSDDLRFTNLSLAENGLKLIRNEICLPKQKKL